jgi:hypothetical protein
MNETVNMKTLLGVVFGICLLGGAAVILTAVHSTDGIEHELSSTGDESREYFV